MWRFAWQCGTEEIVCFLDWAVATGVREEGLAKGMELSVPQCIMYMRGINQLALGLTSMPSCRITLHIVLDLSLDTTVKHF